MSKVFPNRLKSTSLHVNRNGIKLNSLYDTVLITISKSSLRLP